MWITVNVDGQDVFVSEVIDFLTMLSFHAQNDFTPEPGTVVVIHAETENQRLTASHVITAEEEEE